MELEKAEFSDCIFDLIQHLEKGLVSDWPHEVRKELLLLMHRMKNRARQETHLDLETELIAIEQTLGYGAGNQQEINSRLVEDHISRLNQLTTAEEVQKVINGANDYENCDKSLQFQDESIKDTDKNEVPVSLEKIENDFVTKPEEYTQLILCNCPGRDAARELARKLVEKRLAACVNFIANIGSIYWWQGEIKDTAECQLQIKTASRVLDDAVEFIKTHHPDDVPEVLVIPIQKGNTEYFDWVQRETENGN